jgi:hypothetical protein
MLQATSGVVGVATVVRSVVDTDANVGVSAENVT